MLLVRGKKGLKPKQFNARSQPGDHHAPNAVKSLRVKVHTSKLSKSYLSMQSNNHTVPQLNLTELCTLIWQWQCHYMTKSKSVVIQLNLYVSSLETLSNSYTHKYIMLFYFFFGLLTCLALFYYCLFSSLHWGLFTYSKLLHKEVKG